MSRIIVEYAGVAEGSAAGSSNVVFAVCDDGVYWELWNRFSP